MDVLKALMLQTDYHKNAWRQHSLWLPCIANADIIIFVLVSSSFFFPRLISAVAHWMSTVLPHMMWPLLMADLPIHQKTETVTAVLSQKPKPIFIYNWIQNSTISSTAANWIVTRLYTWTRYFTCMKMVEVRCRLQLSSSSIGLCSTRSLCYDSAIWN